MRRFPAYLAHGLLLAVLTACGIPDVADEGQDLENPFPGPPTQISALGGSDSVLLGWQPNVTGAKAERFNVYDAAVPGMPLANVVSAPNMSYQVTSLAPGSYTYRIVGTNLFGVEGEPGSAEATVSVTIPNTPAGVALNATGEDTVAVTWSAGTGSSTAVTSHYRIYKALASGGALDGGTDTPDTSLSFNYSGLAAGTRYLFEVAAVSTDSEISPHSSEGVQRSTWASAPGAVTVQGQAVDVEAIGWTPPAGQAVTAYQVTNLTSNVTLPDVAGTSTQETGLTAGTTYSYTVTSLNEDGIAGNASAPVSAPTLADPPALVVDSVGNQQVELLWNAVPSATGYNIYRSDTQGILGPLVTTVTPGTATTFTDTAVSNGTEYYYMAKTVNASGEGPVSAEISATPTAALLPPPTLTVAVAQNGQVILNWSSIPGAVSYNIYRSTTPAVQGPLLTNVSPGTASTLTDASVVNGTTYHYVAATVNAGNVEGTLSAEVSATPTNTVTPPSNLVVFNLHDQATLHSGFIVGTLTPGTATSPAVEVSLDGGAFAPAAGTSIFAASTWTFALPAGASALRQGSTHTVAVRVNDGLGNILSSPVFTVKQGQNQDMDGDGTPDVVIGAPASGGFGPGQVFINHSFGGGVFIDGESVGDEFGRAIAVGDFNGDGLADLAVGAPGSFTSAGQAYIFYATIGSGVAPASAGSADHTIIGAAANDQVGKAVATGDVNGDGYDDLIIGAPGTSSPPSAYVFHSLGSPGIASTATVSNPDTGLVTAPGTFFGSTVAVGDMNGDGFADLVVGASLTNSLNGQVLVFHSTGASGIPSNFVNAVTSADTQLNGTTGGLFGTIVAAGDINNDGRADIVASSINKVSVFHAGAGGVASGNDTSAQTAITEEAGQSSLSFGGALAIGSINGSFFPALVVTDAGYSLSPPSSTEGRIYVFQSATNGSGLPAGTINAASADAIITGEAPGDHFGTAVSMRDVSTDGFGDIIAGASVRNAATGRVYQFESAADGSGAAPYDGITAASAIQFFNGLGINILFGGALAP